MAQIGSAAMPVGAQAWGLEPGYESAAREWVAASPAATRAVLERMGAEGDAPAPERAPVVVIREGETHSPGGPWELTLEDGTRHTGSGPLPRVGIGYHQLVVGDAEPVRLIVSPGTCFLPPDLRAWGWAVQLYAMRSARSWGIGDLADLSVLTEWSAGRGAGAVLLNPLHAALPGEPQQTSPYYPSSRCFRNPLYLSVPDVPGAREASLDLDAFAARGRVMNQDRLIDRDAVEGLKMAALQSIFDSSRPGPGFDAYCTEGGDLLLRFATFCALSDEYGRPWTEWPEALRTPHAGGVERFAREHASRMRFHQWLQWCLDLQLASAASEVPLIHDLAIGVDPAGADAWMWQDALALGVRVGAPPDEFNAAGQDWGLPPFDPWKLRSLAYEPFIATVRAGFRHAGALRFDHVMGLFRLYWIPDGFDADDGVYVRYPWRDLLDILVLESVRASAYVVGEDLGTVEDSMRDELATRRILSYRLVWFEEEAPAEFPREALAAVTTHDLPTIAGLWTGADLEAQQGMGLEANAEGTTRIRDHVADITGLPAEADVDEVVLATYSALAEAPSRVVLATLDDALGVEERPNHPGTTDEWPNWCLALPAALEDALADPRVERLAHALDRHVSP